MMSRIRTWAIFFIALTTVAMSIALAYTWSFVE